MASLTHKTIREAIDKVKSLLAEEEQLSPGLKAAIHLMLILTEALLKRLGINSKNSSLPPSSDPNRKKPQRPRKKTMKKPGGQPGRAGKQLQRFDNPDKVEVIRLDKRTLPKDKYKEVSFKVRQVIDVEAVVHVTEYQAQVLENSQGKQFVAPFPEHVSRPVQYGSTVKAQAVYLSQFQLLPYARVTDYIKEQWGLPLSPGSLFNFHQQAYKALETFEAKAKLALVESPCLHADETGVNVNSKRLWLHTVCNDKWTQFMVHSKRGKDAMDAMEILPQFTGVLCHDHWKPYYRYSCEHALCNAHHLRELEWSATIEQQSWASEMSEFLTTLNETVKEAGGVLSSHKQRHYQIAYRHLLDKAQIECPLPDPPKEKKRGRVKKSKSRNLLERLITFEDDVLRFMRNTEVPFTNNQGENDLRMTKVQQKISGCFRSMEGARMFCRIRAYLITCRKHGVEPTTALNSLFKGKLPDFVV